MTRPADLTRSQRRLLKLAARDADRAVQISAGAESAVAEELAERGLISIEPLGPLSTSAAAIKITGAGIEEARKR